MRVKHVYVDFSSLEAYYECPRRFGWNLVEGLVPAAEKDPSLANTFLGTVFHSCIDALYQGKDWRDTFRSHLDAPGVIAINEKRSDLSGSRIHLQTVIERYIANYNAPNDHEFEVVATEKRLEMPLSPRITYVGNVDKEIITTEGNRAILDHKTSSSLKTWVKPTIHLSDQFTGYLALAQANGIPAETMIIDGVSTARKALDEDEGLFERYVTFRHPLQIEEWKKVTLHWCNRMIEDIENSTFAPKKPKPCTAFGGCIYTNVCATFGTSSMALLHNNFIKGSNPWHSFKVVYE